MVSWDTHLMKIWREMKRKNKHTKFSDAMKKASRTWKS